jgi:hypothetical protein
MVTLLKKLNLEVSEEFTDEQDTVYLEIRPDGTGAVKVYARQLATFDDTLFNFTSVDDLMNYLEGGQLKRLVMQSCR